MREANTWPCRALTRRDREAFPDDTLMRLVDQNSASWNRVMLWMRQLESLSRAS